MDLRDTKMDLLRPKFGYKTTSTEITYLEIAY